jgi:hypothetical protein
MNRSTRVVGLLALAVLSGSPARADTETFEYFFKAQDTILSPGEKLSFQLWGRLKPGVGEPAIWNGLPGIPPNVPPQPATVGWFAAADFNLWTLSVAGVWLDAKKNPDPHFLALPGIGKFNEYGVSNINLSNKGFQATEFLMYSYVWQPKVYENQEMTLSIMSGPPYVTLILDGTGMPFSESWAWSVEEMKIQIVPAPGAGLLALTAGVVSSARRGRRRGTP